MSNKYSQADVANHIASQLSEDIDEQDLAISVASYLIDEGKTASLDSLLRDVMELRAKNGIVELTARSAFAIAPEQKVMIQKVAKNQYPGAHKVIIHEILDPTVIGGVSLSLANSSLDMTIKSKLNHLREAIA